MDLVPLAFEDGLNQHRTSPNVKYLLLHFNRKAVCMQSSTYEGVTGIIERYFSHENIFCDSSLEPPKSDPIEDNNLCSSPRRF